MKERPEGKPDVVSPAYWYEPKDPMMTTELVGPPCKTCAHFGDPLHSGVAYCDVFMSWRNPDHRPVDCSSHLERDGLEHLLILLKRAVLLNGIERRVWLSEFCTPKGKWTQEAAGITSQRTRAFVEAGKLL